MDKNKHFVDRLIQEIRRKKSFVVLGLDPRPEMLPEFLYPKKNRGQNNLCQELSQAIWTFNQELISAVAPYVVAVKPQIAFYQCLGWQGLKVFAQTIDYSQRLGLPVIADAKCNDIGTTAGAYAQAFLGSNLCSREKIPSAFAADAVTINPYLGWDGIEPFVQAAESQAKGIFVLVRTSNPSAGDIQNLSTPQGYVYQVLGKMVHEWGQSKKGNFGYSCLGAVVGATYSQEAAQLRQIMPSSFFLVPGYGTQGGSTKDIIPCFHPDGLGAVISASRSIIYAFQNSPWREDVSEKEFAKSASLAAKAMRDEINEAVARELILPW